MNRTVFGHYNRKREDMNKSYLKTKVPSDRYTLFLRGNFLVFVGYVIATAETFLAIYFGLSDLGYERTLYISIFVLLISSVLIAITYFNKNLLVWQEFSIFGIYLITFLFAFCLWVYWLGDLRILGILNALTAVTIVLSYTNVIQSMMMSVSTLTCYCIVTWYSIKIAGQPGMLVKETFLSFCLLPGFLLISMAAYYINKRRKDLQKVKYDLEKLNNNLSEVNEKLINEQLLTEIEMDLAGEIQRAIFPKRVPRTSDWDLAFMTKPFGSVSGDFYDFYCSDGVFRGVSLFDVSGHGVAPALITILAKPLLYSNFIKNEFSRLGEVIELTNAELLEELEEVNLYITGLVLRMNGNEVEYINAGHPDLLHFKSSEKKVRVITDPSDSFKGPPIGISISDQKYASVKFKVREGDFLILYSDGLTESKNHSGEQFGLERLSDAVTLSQSKDAHGILKNIIDSFNDFSGDAHAGDDITIIIAAKL